MPFRLPPPWDPGFALPNNVRDEGLERRTFVTRQMPRGTYDDPHVGGGGYTVPQYVLDERYGQGTFTTKWQPRGTYNGPKVPNWLNKRPDMVSDARLPGGGRELQFVRKQGMQGLGDAPRFVQVSPSTTYPTAPPAPVGVPSAAARALPIVLLGGAAVAAYLLIKRRKKGAAAPPSNTP